MKAAHATGFHGIAARAMGREKAKPRARKYPQRMCQRVSALRMRIITAQATPIRARSWRLRRTSRAGTMASSHPHHAKICETEVCWSSPILCAHRQKVALYASGRPVPRQPSKSSHTARMAKKVIRLVRSGRRVRRREGNPTRARSRRVESRRMAGSKSETQSARPQLMAETRCQRPGMLRQRAISADQAMPTRRRMRD